MAPSKKTPKIVDLADLHLREARDKFASLPYWNRVTKMVWMFGLDRRETIDGEPNPNYGKPRPKVIARPDRSIAIAREAGKQGAKEFQAMQAIPVPAGHVRTGYSTAGPVDVLIRPHTPDSEAHAKAVERTRKAMKERVAAIEAAARAAQKPAKKTAKKKGRR